MWYPVCPNVLYRTFNAQNQKIIQGFLVILQGVRSSPFFIFIGFWLHPNLFLVSVGAYSHFYFLYKKKVSDKGCNIDTIWPKYTSYEYLVICFFGIRKNQTHTSAPYLFPYFFFPIFFRLSWRFEFHMGLHQRLHTFIIPTK